MFIYLTINHELGMNEWLSKFHVNLKINQNDRHYPILHIFEWIIQKSAVKSLTKRKFSVDNGNDWRKEIQTSKKKTLRCSELENEVRFQLKNFCFALPFSVSCDLNENGNAKQKNFNWNPTLFFNSLQRNVFFSRSLNFFFPSIIFVIDRKFVLFKLFTADFSIVNCTIVLQ